MRRFVAGHPGVRLSTVPASATDIHDLVFGEWVKGAEDQASKDGVTGTPTVLVDGEKLTDLSPDGLTAAVWTRDEEAAVRIGDRLETGTVFMNRCDYLDPALAWTGVKDSGRGVALSRLAYEHLTRPKSFHLRRAG